MSYFDDWEYDTKEFLTTFLDSDFNQTTVINFMKKFDLTQYELLDSVKSAKHALMVHGNSDYTISSTDLAWISDSTSVLVATSDDRNLIFVDLDSMRDAYYLNSAALIKIFNRAFPKNNLYIIRACEGIAIGSMRKFNCEMENNFCITQLFAKNSLDIMMEFLYDLSFDEYNSIPATIIDYSPQEHCRYIKPRTCVDDYYEDMEQIEIEFEDDFRIYTTYIEVCRILESVANYVGKSSFDVLEEALSVEKMASAVSEYSVGNGAPLVFEEEGKYSKEAFKDAEQMLKEMLGKK